MNLDFQKVLAFFAHPDDETLAAGGTIHRLAREGCDVFVAVPFRGIVARYQQKAMPWGEIRFADDMDRKVMELRANCLHSLVVLGIEDPPRHSLFAEFPDNMGDTVPRLSVIQWLESTMSGCGPFDLVLTHHALCANVDHRRCHEAAMIACRPSLDALRTAVLCGEVPSATGNLRPAAFEPNVYVALEREDVEAKVAAMACYESEVRPSPHPRSPEVLEALARVRGAEAGVEFAEAFVAWGWVL